MIKNIAVTGYYWSGSSAVLDLLSEYESVCSVPINRDWKDYEHVLFYYRGGLFDLCNHLMHGNTVVGSDYAVNVFLDSMERLYYNRFVWFGSYKNLIGEDFLKIVEDFIKEIAVEFQGRNLNHAVGTAFSALETIKKIRYNFLHRKFFDNPFVKKTIFDDKKVYISLPKKDELINASQRFTKSYLNLFNVTKGVDYRLFDHLIWPQQINEFSKYLDPDLKMVVVQRDVRDVYISNKYLSRVHFFPTKVDEFIELYKKIVTSINNNPNVIIVNFEDLIYKYDEVEKMFEKQLGLIHNAHINRNKYFNPTRSIDNTQVYRCKNEWLEESVAFEVKLPFLCYQFPFERVPDINKIMDRTA